MPPRRFKLPHLLPLGVATAHAAGGPGLADSRPKGRHPHIRAARAGRRVARRAARIPLGVYPHQRVWGPRLGVLPAGQAGGGGHREPRDGRLARAARMLMSAGLAACRARRCSRLLLGC